MNEGGLFGEREGWHLPGFDTSSWPSRPLPAGLANGGKAGIGFFVTTFELDVPHGVDAAFSFAFSGEQAPYRALLYVNGWKFGKRVANIGPQTVFPVPPGILDYNGEKYVSLFAALRCLAERGALAQLQLRCGSWRMSKFIRS